MKERLSLRKRWTLLLVACGALLVSAGVAYATIPDSSGQYHACVKRTGDDRGEVRIVDHSAGQNCQQNQQHVHWSQSGAPGPAGPQGPPGPQGPQGPAGPTNLVVRQGPVSAPGFGSVVNCNAGERATGGGGVVATGAAGELGLRLSSPNPNTAGSTPIGWLALGEGGSTVQAWVVCAS